MTEMIFKLLGGIGLFLMGMIMLTDGLKAFAGDSLRRGLLNFTGSPLRAFVAGALVTLMVQSSSATTITVIGFVSAGLMPFAQALGVVMGASLGTTGTGWVVAVLGLKISLGYYALPLVGVGAFIKLLGAPAWRPLGMSIAGFGLIFIGIETLQQAMSGLSAHVDLGALPSAGLLGHTFMMLVGIILTIVMQSSSATVATTLTALHTQSINFEQACSLVIGAAIGTTVTGVLAAIGGSIPAKRTALAHVLFNLATGVLAIIALPGLLWLVGVAQAHLGLAEGAMSLAAFHTLFITLGVLVFLPFVGAYARWIERLLPDVGPSLTRHLDASVMALPAVALEMTRRALRDLARAMFQHFGARFTEASDTHRSAHSGKPVAEQASPADVARALEEIPEFLSRIPPLSDSVLLAAEREAQIHAIDHLTRLRHYADLPSDMARVLDHSRLMQDVKACRDILQSATIYLGEPTTEGLDVVREQAAAISERRRQQRALMLHETAQGRWPPSMALDLLDAMRWLDGVAYHVWRICHHLLPRNEQEADDESGARFEALKSVHSDEPR